jgi:hypothetical protein
VFVAHESAMGRTTYVSIVSFRLAAELIRRPVDLIVATGGAHLAAKAATSTIPIVFTSGDDAIKEGLVASFNRPGGNATGATVLSATLAAKWLAIVLELIPSAALIGALSDPNSQEASAQLTQLQAAARASGLQVRVLNAGTENDIETAFASINGMHIDVLLVGATPFFRSRRCCRQPGRHARAPDGPMVNTRARLTPEKFLALQNHFGVARTNVVARARAGGTRSSPRSSPLSPEQRRHQESLRNPSPLVTSAARLFVPQAWLFGYSVLVGRGVVLRLLPAPTGPRKTVVPTPRAFLFSDGSSGGHISRRKRSDLGMVSKSQDCPGETLSKAPHIEGALRHVIGQLAHLR